MTATIPPPTRRSSISAKAIAAAIAVMAAVSTGRMGPTTTIACWCMCRKILMCAGPVSLSCSSTAMAQRWSVMSATANWCRSRSRIRASTPCCWRRSSPSMPRIPVPASSGSPAASSALWMNRQVNSPVSTAIRMPPRRLQTCRSSLSAIAAASCRRHGASKSAASATASAACSCSTPFTANSTSSHHGSSIIGPASSSLPTPTTPRATTASS